MNPKNLECLQTVRALLLGTGIGLIVDLTTAAGVGGLCIGLAWGLHCFIMELK
jgi:glycerol uptake facilitator-like aquaporin